MTDVLERLRADNPVPTGSPPSFEEVWARLERESSTSRPARRRLRRTRALAIGAVAMVPVVVVAVIAITTLGRKGAPAGGGAAANGAFLVRYRARTVIRPAASSGASFAYDVSITNVWVSGASAHRIETDYFYSRTGRAEGTPLQHEISTDGRRLENFQAGSLNPAGELTEAQASHQTSPCPLFVACAGQVSVDPLAEVRQLYKTGALVRVPGDTRLNGRAVDELKSTRSNEVVEMFVDPRTFLPLEVKAQYGSKPWPVSATQTTTISDYQRVPLTSSNRWLLRMRPHPGARRLCAGPGGGGPVPPGSGQGCVSRVGRPSVAPPPPLPGRLVAQINLTAPGSSRSPAGIAQVFRQGKRLVVRIQARGVRPTRHNSAYAVWLTGGPDKKQLLGFITPSVRSNHRLSAQGGLPAAAPGYHQLLITLEHNTTPTRPGAIILRGAARF